MDGDTGHQYLSDKYSEATYMVKISGDELYELTDTDRSESESKMESGDEDIKRCHVAEQLRLRTTPNNRLQGQ